MPPACDAGVMGVDPQCPGAVAVGMAPRATELEAWLHMVSGEVDSPAWWRCTQAVAQAVELVRTATSDRAAALGPARTWTRGGGGPGWAW